MKTHIAIAAAALMSGLAVAQDAYAVPQNNTVAKVLEVSTTAPRNTAFGPLVLLTVTFDRNIGTGCTSNNMATFAAGQQADAATRELNHLALSEMRSVAVAARLSGRSVTVRNAVDCSIIGGHGLDFITLL